MPDNAGQLTINVWRHDSENRCFGVAILQLSVMFSRLMQRCMDGKLDQHHAREVNLVNVLHILVKLPFDVSRGAPDYWFDCCDTT